MTPDFRIEPDGLFYNVISVASGQPVVELIDCRADAQAYAEEHQARLDDKRAAEARAAADDLAEIHALDRVYAGIDAMRDGTPAMDRAVDRAMALIDEQLAGTVVEMARAA